MIAQQSSFTLEAEVANKPNWAALKSIFINLKGGVIMDFPISDLLSR